MLKTIQTNVSKHKKEQFRIFSRKGDGFASQRLELSEEEDSSDCIALHQSEACFLNH